MRAQQQYPPAWAGSPSPPGAAALGLPQGEPEEGGAHRDSGSPCPPRYSTRSMCAGTGSTQPRAGAGPQHASGRRASRLQAWSLAGAVYKPTGWGLLAGSAPASPWSYLQIGLLRQSGPGLPRPRRRRTRRTWRPPSWARLRLLTLDPARPEKPRPYWPRLRRECPGSCRG